MFILYILEVMDLRFVVSLFFHNKKEFLLAYLKKMTYNVIRNHYVLRKV
jgi:hypothetical protein